MAEQLKNLFFTRESLDQMADSIMKNYPDFDKNAFLQYVFSATWNNLELKQKMRHVSTSLHEHLPEDYDTALQILEKTAPEIKGFDSMSLPDYVEQYGLEHLERSLRAMEIFTRYSSSEFAIRPFLIRYPERVMEYLDKLANSENHMVRRFASEGCRPRLPWARAVPFLKKYPLPIIPILEKLKNDESEFVRKSVANNLNDISKDHPELVIDLAKKWKGHSENTDRILKHGLRTLLKKGNKEALELFGYNKLKSIKLISLKINDHKIRIGNSSGFIAEFENTGKRPEKLRLEYAVQYRKANGSLSAKIFQIMEKEFQPGKHKLKRKLTFKDMTTRKHFSGEHFLSFVINGQEYAKTGFELVI